MSGNGPKPGRTSSEAVTEHIRGMIHRGELVPGEFLPPERQFAERLGIGRETLRGAIRNLQEDGYLETFQDGPKGGTYVTDLVVPQRAWLKRMLENQRDLEDLLDYRTALEEAASRFAAERADDSDLEAIAEAVVTMRSAADLHSYRQSDSAFHIAIGRAARSQRLLAGIERTRSELFTPTDALPFAIMAELTIKQHEEILDALRDRDSELAGHLMRDHIEGSRQQLNIVLERASEQFAGK